MLSGSQACQQESMYNLSSSSSSYTCSCMQSCKSSVCDELIPQLRRGTSNPTTLLDSVTLLSVKNSLVCKIISPFKFYKKA